MTVHVSRICKVLFSKNKEDKTTKREICEQIIQKRRYEWRASTLKYFSKSLKLREMQIKIKIR